MNKSQTGNARLRVACIGNMNNNFFCLTRLLRDRGVDAHLFLFDNEIKHFLPDADTRDKDYTSYTHQLSWGNYSKFYKTSGSSIRRTFQGFDFLIACGTAPAFLHRAGLRVDLFVPYGGDVVDLPFVVTFRKWKNFSEWKHALICWVKELGFAWHQRFGIRESRRINCEYWLYPKEWGKIRPQGDLCFWGCPFVYPPHFNPDMIASSGLESECFLRFKQIREAHDLMVFHHSRHIWKTRLPQYLGECSVGNDRLIQGFFGFVHEHPDKKACLVLFEYGPDVAASKELVESLGISSKVFWFPKVSRKDLALGLALSDIGVGPLVAGTLYCGVIQEILAMGKPMIHYRNDAMFKDLPFDSLYPVINAGDAEGIKKTFEDYVERPEHYHQLGQEGRAWLLRDIIQGSVDRIVSMVQDSGKQGEWTR